MAFKLTDYVSLTDKEEYQLIAVELKSPWFYTLLLLLLGAGYYFKWPLVYMPLLLLIPALLIDARRMILPDVITVPLLLLGLFLAPISLTASLLGAVVGLVSFALLEIIMTRALGRPALGWGDVKLLGALGAWGGLLALPLVLLFASWSAGVFVMYRRLFTNQDKCAPFPFGPFLIVGGVVAILYSQPIWRWLTELY